MDLFEADRSETYLELTFCSSVSCYCSQKKSAAEHYQLRDFAADHQANWLFANVTRLISDATGKQ